jgi:RND superfamily putative drug exporter
VPEVQSRLDEEFAGQGLDVSLVGPASFWGEVNELGEEGLFHAELITLPLIVLVLLIVVRRGRRRAGGPPRRRPCSSPASP